MMIRDNDAEKALNYIRDNAERGAYAKGRVKAIEHKLKVVKSQEFLKAEGTVAEREAKAYASQAYQSELDEYEKAVTESDTIMTLIKAADLKIEVWRTQQANNRRGNI